MFSLNNLIKGKTTTSASSSLTNETNEQQPRKGKRLSEEDPKSLMKRVALGDVTNKQEKHNKGSTTLTRLTRVCVKIKKDIRQNMQKAYISFSAEQKERAWTTEFVMCRVCRQDLPTFPRYSFALLRFVLFVYSLIA